MKRRWIRISIRARRNTTLEVYAAQTMSSVAISFGVILALQLLLVEQSLGFVVLQDGRNISPTTRGTRNIGGVEKFTRISARTSSSVTAENEWVQQGSSLTFNGTVTATAAAAPSMPPFTKATPTDALIPIAAGDGEGEADNQFLQAPDALTLWRRRLITHEDPFSVHKISSLLYTASAIVILGTGAFRFLADDEHALFAEIPTFLELPSLAFVASNMVMCVASVRMAFLHRKFDLTARNAFLGTAASSLFSGFYFLWTSPFAPDAFNDALINRSCFGILVLLNVIFIMDTLLNIPEVVESRRDRKADDYDGRFLVDALGYVLPIGWGFIPVISTGYIASVLHDRPWFMEQCSYIDQVTGTHGINANICYLQVLTSMAASYGSLFVTLRDKKLISKQQELGWITAFSVPAMLWTIYVTFVFASHLFDSH